MKKVLTAIALSGICLLTSCGSKQNEMKSAANSANMGNAAYESYSDEAAEPMAQENYDNSSIDAKAADYKQSDVKAINLQMLVYSCDMSIDVLEFDESVTKFHDLINKYKGFLESENYSDGGSSTKWQYTDEQKWKTLNAVIRIPSASYDNFCKEAENIGDMRRKNASVQNLTTEYSDLKTTLSIYEAKEKRYIDLLSEIKSESEAISVENELTDIQIQIAKLKTRMNNIENDVAYSYINLTLNEVREYTEEPIIEKTDTFGQRLMNTISRTWRGFLEFLEGMLFLIIRLLPYLLVFGIILFGILKLRKAIKKRKASRPPKAKPAKMNAQPDTHEAAEKAENEVQEDAPKEK